LTEQATLILLAGGASTRMGRPKHLLPTPQGTLIEHLHRRLAPLFIETLVVGRGLRLTGEGLRVVEDAFPRQSPLVGIYSGLLAAKSDLAFILACDMPFVNPELVAYLLSQASGVHIVVPVVNGYYEPLCAVYRRTAIPVIREALNRGTLKVTQIYDCLRLRTVTERKLKPFDPELASLINLNTPKELKLLAQLDHQHTGAMNPCVDGCRRSG